MRKFIGLQNQTGQALIEAAFALPFVLILSFLVIDVGTGFFARGTMNNIARDEVRILATDPKLNPNYRPPTGSTETPQQAATRAVSESKARIATRLAPIAGVGKPISVSNDGIQVLVPGISGTTGNLTDNPVEVRITRQLSLITANFIPSEVANRLLSTTVSASAFVEKGTISGNINLDGVTDTTALCEQAGICTCKTDEALCTPIELCEIHEKGCTAQQNCDLFGVCDCATKESLCTCETSPAKCTPEELCTIRGDSDACCKLYGGADGKGKYPNSGQDACSVNQRCYKIGGGTEECCKAWPPYWCPGGTYCEKMTYYLSLFDEITPALLASRANWCCWEKPGPDNPYCCEYYGADYCKSNSTKCAEGTVAACCLLKTGEAGAEKCTCKNDPTRCDSAGACEYYPGTAKCCESDPVKCCQNNIALCKQEDICLYYKNSDQCCQSDINGCTSEQLCRLKKQVNKCVDDNEKCNKAQDADACCRLNTSCNDCKNNGSAKACCVYNNEKGGACCELIGSSCTEDKLLCAYHGLEEEYKEKCKSPLE